jgi:enoyl-CoA hydratase/carnithine racemase
MSEDLGQAPQLEISGGVARIVLARPRQHNRLDPDDTAVLAAHVESIVGDATVRVVVITGSGEKTFSAGYNVATIVGNLDDRFEKMLDAVENIAVPTVCALNGGAYGGATDLALACDFRIGVTGSRMFMPAARFGLRYYPGGLRRYFTRLGLNQAKKLFLTGMAIDAEEMKRIGFLTELVEPDQLQATVQSYVVAILECEPVALCSLKTHLNALADGRFDASRAAHDYIESVNSDTLRERLAARGK